MTIEKPNTSMSQEIFTLGFDTETISLYLLCCGIVDIGDILTDRALEGVWNGSGKAMRNALDKLLRHGILRQAVSGDENQRAYQLMPQDRWQTP